MITPEARYGALIVEQDPVHCFEIVTVCRDPHGPTDARYRVQALEHGQQAIATFPCLEAGNWYVQTRSLTERQFYIVTVFPGAVARLVV